NGGKDQFGRQVANPAGIDLSEGTWADLGMTNNDWVIVEFLWTAP
ncbi:MAG: Secreted protein, partial [Candidatus Nomurabacteria bacterium GW2011_GWA1_46_11]